MTTDSIGIQPSEAVVQVPPRLSKRRLWWAGLALALAALASAAMVLPAYREMPPPGMERGLPALITPTPFSGRYLYPWLLDMDRRLLLLGGLALFCKLCAQLPFPAMLAPRAVQETRAVPPAAQGATLGRQLKAVKYKK